MVGQIAYGIKLLSSRLSTGMMVDKRDVFKYWLGLTLSFDGKHWEEWEELEDSEFARHRFGEIEITKKTFYKFIKLLNFNNEAIEMIKQFEES